LLGVEPAGQAWIDFRDRVRAVLNAEWDPIGVAAEVTDEYDSYLGGIHSLLARDASADELAAHLLRIETETMELSPQPAERRRAAAHRLRTLQLPPR
jgi:hypothetical protein